MKKIILALSVAFAIMGSAHSMQLMEFVENLARPRTYSAEVAFDVSLPITGKEVHYNVKIFSAPSRQGDCLSPVDYLVETTDSMGGVNFYSYFDGNYFRFANNRMSEYHWNYDSIPFLDHSQGKRQSQAVQTSGLFASLVPGVLSRELKRLIAIPENEVSLARDSNVRGHVADVLRVKEIVAGVPLREMEYAFTGSSHEPLYYQMVSNPGGVGEQTIEARFTTVDSVLGIREPMLVGRYKSLFERFRMGNYSVNSLKGRSLPLFSLPSVSGSRYEWIGEEANPTVVVFLDSAGGLTAQTVAAVRNAVDEMPLAVELLWVFVDKDLCGITAEMPKPRAGEHLLFNGKSFAVRCGVTGCPTVLIVNRDGIVKNAIVGYNNNMKSDVIQQTAFSVK